MKIKISAHFTKGFYRAMDLSGAKKWPQLSNAKRADYEALRSDWENVGKSIKRETERYKRSSIS